MLHTSVATMMRTDELDFHLPPELIAQLPPPDRAASRLLHYKRSIGVIEHRGFSDLPRLLRAGDLLVFNDTRVIPARFVLKKITGGRVEGLYLQTTDAGRWRVMLRNLGQYRGDRLHFEDAPQISAAVTSIQNGGICELDVNSTEPAAQLLGRIGRMPLPPYIKRDKDHDDRDILDRERYQTLYAHDPGSVAAPTAGLHFTPALFSELDSLGIRRAFVTLHVGMGTFKPVTADTLEAHQMHAEAYSISSETADAVNTAKKEGRRVIAIGTTSARVLESQPASQPIAPITGETSIFIYPPYQWHHVDALLTNFHLPRSTLIALVAAMIGLDAQRRIYAQAIAQRYRFFSYGDAMFIE